MYLMKCGVLLGDYDREKNDGVDNVCNGVIVDHGVYDR